MARTRIDTIENAIIGGTKLAFDYMPKDKGRAAIERRIIAPLAVSQSKAGKVTVMGESGERQGALRAFRVDRMFHVTTTA